MDKHQDEKGPCLVCLGSGEVEITWRDGEGAQRQEVKACPRGCPKEEPLPPATVARLSDRHR